MIRRLQINDGFSLLEALVALALTAMVMGALGTITHSWLPTWMRGFSRLQETNDVATALDRITNDLIEAQFVPRKQSGRDPLFEGGTSTLILVRSSIGPNAKSALDIVRWSIVEANGEYRLFRSRANYSPAAAAERSLAFSDRTSVLRSSYPLSFSYAGPDQVVQHSWLGRPELPSTVKISVLAPKKRLTTTVSMPARVPLDCVTSKAAEACLHSSATQGRKPWTQ